MGIFHMNVKIVNKAKQSAIAKAAYVSGQKIYSERDEENKNYRKREVLPESFILAPLHAPNWVYNREKLWNEVEKIEKPFNAQLLREVVVALPIEFSKDKNIELISEFVKTNFVDAGMVADVNVHYDKDENPHAHVLLTVRPFNEDGSWGNKSKKEYILDENGNNVFDDNGKKKTRKINLTNWNDKNTLVKWRENWAEAVNEKYKELGIKTSISHLSNEKLSLEKLPRHRLTREEYYVEEKAKQAAIVNSTSYEPVTTYGKLNYEVEKFNQQLDLINSQIISLEAEKEQLDGTKNSLVIFANRRENMFVHMAELSEEIKESVQFMQKRYKTDFITLDNVNDFEKSMKNWTNRISRAARELESSKVFLQEIKNTFEKNPENLYKFGLTKESFVTEYNALLEQFKYNEKKLTNEYENYKNIKGIQQAFDEAYYKEIFKQFTGLYPEYETIVRFKTNENLKVMAKCLEEVSDLNKKVLVKDFYENDILERKDEHELRKSISKNLEQYQQFIKLQFTFNKAFENLQSKYTDQLLNGQMGDEVVKTSVEYLKTKREFEYIQEKLNGAKKGMYDDLITIYGDENKGVINQLRDKEKVQILKTYIDDRVYIDLDTLKQSKEYEQYQKQAAANKPNTGDLMSQMLAALASESMAQDPKRNKFDQQKRKKRNRFSNKSNERNI